MFQYNCTIFREQNMPGLKQIANNKLLLQGSTVRSRFLCWCFNRCILQILLNQIATFFLSTFCLAFLKLLIAFISSSSIILKFSIPFINNEPTTECETL